VRDLHLFTYKIQLAQELQFIDHEMRLEYSRALLELADQDDAFHYEFNDDRRSSFSPKRLCKKAKLQVLSF